MFRLRPRKDRPAPSAAAQLHGTHRLEQPQGFPNRPPSDVEPIDQFVLSCEMVAGLQSALTRLADQPSRHL